MRVFVRKETTTDVSQAQQGVAEVAVGGDAASSQASGAGVPCKMTPTGCCTCCDVLCHAVVWCAVSCCVDTTGCLWQRQHPLAA